MPKKAITLTKKIVEQYCNTLPVSRSGHRLNYKCYADGRAPGYNTTVILDVSIRWTMRKEDKLYWPDLACFTHYKRQKNELKLASAETYAYCRKWYFK